MSKTITKRPALPANPDESRMAAMIPKIERSERTPVFETDENGVIKPTEKTPLQERLATAETTGSASAHFNSYLFQSLGALSDERYTELNAGLAFMRGLGPQDEAEALLIEQMFAIHVISMRFASQAMKSSDLAVVEPCVNRMNRLMSRYAEHLDALNKNRGKGHQKMTVEHVNVFPGGQAVIGNIGKGGRGRGKR